MDKYIQLERGIALAVEAHTNQFDKSGKPYILHPLHLMTQLLFDMELATIAVLHDVVEDSWITIGNLVDLGYSTRVVSALSLLTHDEEDSYEDYIEGICVNFDAIRVKRKDLEHNSCVTRLKGLSSKDLRRIEKYHEAFVRLGVAKRHISKKNHC